MNPSCKNTTGNLILLNLDLKITNNNILFSHKHPYPPFLFQNTEKLIVGTLPPPRFYKGKLKIGDVDFCYGSIDGLLWKILDEIFTLNLEFKTTELAIEQRKNFLIERKIGICDIVDSCERQKIDASDVGMQNIVLRDLLHYLKRVPNVHTLLLTGGNSKNGPEYHLRNQLKARKIKLKILDAGHPKIHSFEFDNRIINVISLIAPSGSANRAIGSNPLYKLRKQENSKYNTFDFRVEQYKKFF